MSFLNFIWIEDNLCLIMNNDFIKNVDKLKEITAKLESNELFSFKMNKYEALSMLNSTWIQQQFECEKSFIEWLDHALKNKFTDYLNNLETIEYKEKKVLVMTGFKPCKDDDNNFVIKPLNITKCKPFYDFLKIKKNVIKIF